MFGITSFSYNIGNFGDGDDIPCEKSISVLS